MKQWQPTIEVRSRFTLVSVVIFYPSTGYRDALANERCRCKVVLVTDFPSNRQYGVKHPLPSVDRFLASVLKKASAAVASRIPLKILFSSLLVILRSRVLRLHGGGCLFQGSWQQACRVGQSPAQKPKLVA